MRKAIFAAVAAATGALADMGPLLTDTTALDSAGGGCIANPGTSNSMCSDAGVVPDADHCSSLCDAASYCSAMTWHGPTTGEWAGHCVLRKDGVWAPRACGSGCDHTSANKTSGWTPGSGVVWPPAAKGFTPRVKTFWFGANASGIDSPETLALLARHDVAGYGWQTGHPGGGEVGLGEMWQAEATLNLRTYLDSIGNPNQTVPFSYRQIQVALRLFAQCAIAVDDPAYNGLWIKDPADGTTVCLADQPWNTADPYFNFENSSAIDFYVNHVVDSILQDPSLTPGGASFYDESDQGVCGYRAGTCDFSKINATAQHLGYMAFYPRLAAALNGGGVIPIISSVNRFAASGAGLNVEAPCALPEDMMVNGLKNTTFVRFYENWPGSFWTPAGPDLDAANIANAIIEADHNVSNVLHQGGSCPAPDRNITRPGRLGGDVEFAIATYLIVQSPGTTISISSGWMDSDFCWRPDYDVEYGLPLGPPVRTGAYSWSRNYTRATATVDVSQGRNAEVYLLA
jgi:hypothetical protein